MIVVTPLYSKNILLALYEADMRIRVATRDDQYRKSAAIVSGIYK